MLIKRRNCKTCGIRFTPDTETQGKCSDCVIAKQRQQRDESDSWTVPDANGERVEASEYW